MLNENQNISSPLQKKRAKSTCFHGQGCYWAGCNPLGKDYIRLCWKCFLEWELHKEIGESVLGKAKKGISVDYKKILEMEEGKLEFNFQWSNTEKVRNKILRGNIND